jgi:hypothetical protein
MQKQTKIIALAVFAAAIAGIAAATTVESVQAQTLNPTSPDIQRLSPKSFGSKTAGIVCGDQLCSEATHSMNIEDETPVGEITADSSDAPTAKLISIDRYRPSTNQQDAITYKITFSVTAGTANLRDIHINAHSDVDNEDFSISSLNALKSSVNVIRIKALDADSIQGEIVGYSVTGPTGGPQR